MTSAENCLVRLRVKPRRIEDAGYETRTGVGTNWDAGEEMAPAIDIRVRSSKSETRSFLLFPVREGKSPLPFYGEPHTFRAIDRTANS